MSPESQQQPQTLVQAGGRVAEGIVTGLTGTPVLLLIVLLNIAMIVAAAHFLGKLEDTRAKNALQLTDLFRLCITNAREEAEIDTRSGPP